MPELLARHKAILNQSIEKYHGFVFRTVGDSFSAAFDIAGDVLSAAREAQRRLQNACWSPAPIRVRMGIHTSSANVNMVMFPLGVQPFSMVHGKQIELSK
jgi:class 3 adenylate cyclase